MVKYFYVLLLLPLRVCCQQTDSLQATNLPVTVNTIVYQKPKPFSLITNIPKNVAGFAKHSFQKKITMT